MYRIKLASGDESVFKSLDELTAGVQVGIITPQAMIFHQRAERWLVITAHPHYQMALARAAAKTALAADDSEASQPESGRRQIMPAVSPPRRHAVAPGAGPTPPPTRVAPALAPAHKPYVPQAAAPAQPLAVAPAPEHQPVAPVKPPALSQAMPVRAPIAREAPPEAQAPAGQTPTPAVQANAGVVVEEGASVKGLDLVSVGDMLIKKMAEPQAAPRPSRPARTSVSVSVSRQGSAHRTLRTLAIAAGVVAVVAVVLIALHPWARGSAGTRTPRQPVTQVSSTGAGSSAPALDPQPTPTNTDTVASPAPRQATAQPGPVRDSVVTSVPVDSTPSIVRVAAPNGGLALPSGTEALVETTSGGSGPKVAPMALVQSYQRAYAAARSELNLGMLQTGFNQLFARARLATVSSLQETRRLIASANTTIRQYRSQENRIERIYQDSVGPSGRNLNWSPRDLGVWNARLTLKESPDDVRLAGLMLSQADSLIGLLIDQNGQYQLTGDAIVFKNAAATRQYGILRAWLSQQVDNRSGAGDTVPATIRYIVAAIGAARLPTERTGS